jgi:hypothetical protein
MRLMTVVGSLIKTAGPQTGRCPPHAGSRARLFMTATSLRLDPDAQPGEYYKLVGLYDEHTGERAFVHTAQIAVANAVALPSKLKVISVGE